MWCVKVPLDMFLVFVLSMWYVKAFVSWAPNLATNQVLT